MQVRKNYVNDKQINSLANYHETARKFPKPSVLSYSITKLTLNEPVIT